MWYPQGRTLGGSTSINAMIYIRGQKEDYEAWAELGNKHWGYDQVLPFFRRAEANERLNDRYHSSVGAVNVTEQVQHNPLSKAFVRAAQELGVNFVADFNGAAQEGVSWYDVTQKNARRESTATAYLKPIRSRKNLSVVTHALARKIIVRKGRVTGLDMIIDGRPRARAGGSGADLERRRGQLAQAAAAIGHRTGRRAATARRPDRPRPARCRQEPPRSHGRLPHRRDHAGELQLLRSARQGCAGRPAVHHDQDGTHHRFRLRGGNVCPQHPRRGDTGHPDARSAGVRDRSRPDAGQGPRHDDQHLPSAASQYRLGHSAHRQSRTTRPLSIPPSSPIRTTGRSRWKDSAGGGR